MSARHENHTPAHLLERAAELLEEEAELLRTCHTVDGRWGEEEREVQQHYQELLETACAVREDLRAERQARGQLQAVRTFIRDRRAALPSSPARASAQSDQEARMLDQLEACLAVRAEGQKDPRTQELVTALFDHERMRDALMRIGATLFSSDEALRKFAREAVMPSALHLVPAEALATLPEGAAEPRAK